MSAYPGPQDPRPLKFSYSLVKFGDTSTRGQYSYEGLIHNARKRCSCTPTSLLTVECVPKLDSCSRVLLLGTLIPPQSGVRFPSDKKAFVSCDFQLL